MKASEIPVLTTEIEWERSEKLDSSVPVSATP